MTPEQEKAMEHLMEMVSSLADLTQKLALVNYELNDQNQQLLAQLEALRAIAKAKL